MAVCYVPCSLSPPSSSSPSPQVSLPKTKRAAPPVKNKQDLLKAVAQDAEANKQRMMAMEKVGSNAGGPTRPVGGYGSDMSDSGTLAPRLPPSSPLSPSLDSFVLGRSPFPRRF